MVGNRRSLASVLLRQPRTEKLLAGKIVISLESEKDKGSKRREVGYAVPKIDLACNIYYTYSHLLGYGKPLPFNPIALRMAKTPCSFSLSECNRVKLEGLQMVFSAVKKV